MKFRLTILILLFFIQSIFGIDTAYIQFTDYKDDTPLIYTNIHKNHRSNIHSTYLSIPDLTQYSLSQLEVYFAHHNYTETEILAQNTLYMSDEFVRLAKTYIGYKAAITSLYKRFNTKGFRGFLCKTIAFLSGNYSKGLSKRIEKLFQEIQDTKDTHSQQCINRSDTLLKQNNYTCQQQLIRLLESHGDRTIVVGEIDKMAQQLINTAAQYNPIYTYVQNTLNTSIDVLKSTRNTDEFIFHIAFIDHVLCNIEDRVALYINQPPSLLERFPALLMRALTTFVKGLNPLIQVKNTGEFLINIAHFVADVTVGKLYLSEEQYEDRIDDFCLSCAALSPSNLAKLEAEQWIDLFAQIAADFVYAAGVSKTIAYLKEIEALSKAQRQAARIAKKLAYAVDAVTRKNPFAITAEGLLPATQIKQLGGVAKEIITDSKTLLESVCKGVLSDLTNEMAHLRRLFDGKVKGFAECANKYLKLDYEHILGMELKFSRKGIPQIGGFHHDFMQKVEKSGIFKFTNKVIYDHGFYSANLFYNENYVKSITFFPSYWSRKQVINKIYQAYDNFLKSGINPIVKGGKYFVKGSIEEGVDILMYITQNGKIKTAYPILKKVIK